MFPILLCWPTTSEANVDGMAIGFEPSPHIPLHFAAVRQMAAEEQSHRMVSDTQVCIKERCATEFPYAEKMTPTDIHLHLPNICGENSGCWHSEWSGMLQHW